MIDILFKYAWLEPLRSKAGIAIKYVLEHISIQLMRFLKVIQSGTDRRTEFFNILVKTYLARNNIKLFATQ